MKAGGSGFTVVNKATGQCLDVFGGSTASGAKLIQWGCHGGTNQTFIPVTSGTSSEASASLQATAMLLPSRRLYLDLA